MFHRVFDGRQSRNDALVLEISIMKHEGMLDAYGGIGDLSILHGDVEIDPNQHSFTFEFNVGD